MSRIWNLLLVIGLVWAGVSYWGALDKKPEIKEEAADPIAAAEETAPAKPAAFSWMIPQGDAKAADPKPKILQPVAPLSAVAAAPAPVMKTLNPARDVLDPSLPMTQRRETLYELTQTHTAEAVVALSKIARTAVSAKDARSENSFEVSLRITALEAIDLDGVRGEDVRAALVDVLKTQSHPTLRFLASLSLQGIEQGRPGKLNRFIDRVFSEAEHRES